jgi:hypothetical protein
MEKIKAFRRPRSKGKRSKIITSVDQDVRLTLEMLGFNVNALVEELLSNVSGLKKCPCCGREVRPVIKGRTIAE